MTLTYKSSADIEISPFWVVWFQVFFSYLCTKILKQWEIMAKVSPFPKEA